MVRHQENDGCGKAMSDALKIDINSRDFTAIHSKLCPQRWDNNIECITNCLFSAVSWDINMMATVLRTLEEASEQII